MNIATTFKCLLNTISNHLNLTLCLTRWQVNQKKRQQRQHLVLTAVASHPLLASKRTLERGVYEASRADECSYTRLQWFFLEGRGLCLLAHCTEGAQPVHAWIMYWRPTMPYSASCKMTTVMWPCKSVVLIQADRIWWFCGHENGQWLSILLVYVLLEPFPSSSVRVGQDTAL